jgi:hypothetical protein
MVSVYERALIGESAIEQIDPGRRGLYFIAGAERACALFDSYFSMLGRPMGIPDVWDLLVTHKQRYCQRAFEDFLVPLLRHADDISDDFEMCFHGCAIDFISAIRWVCRGAVIVDGEPRPDHPAWCVAMSVSSVTLYGMFDWGECERPLDNWRKFDDCQLMIKELEEEDMDGSALVAPIFDGHALLNLRRRAEKSRQDMATMISSMFRNRNNK